jgi:hypothetical protein
MERGEMVAFGTPDEIFSFYERRAKEHRAKNITRILEMLHNNPELMNKAPG